MILQWCAYIMIKVIFTLVKSQIDNGSGEHINQLQGIIHSSSIEEGQNCFIGENTKKWNPH